MMMVVLLLEKKKSVKVKENPVDFYVYAAIA